jgi:hypothetical protein
MRRLLLVVALLALAGCDASTPPPAPTTPRPEGTAIIGVPASTEPTLAVSDYKITLNWGAPDSVTFTNADVAPLPTVVGIYVGDHPSENPAYQRISFYFRGGYPSYRVGYVTQVTDEAKGDAIPLGGDAFLRVGFIGARAHTDAGAATITTTPTSPIGLSRLFDYGSAGDFEGHVTYGLGLMAGGAKPDVRLGQMRKGDDYIVFLDVKS